MCVFTSTENTQQSKSGLLLSAHELLTLVGYFSKMTFLEKMADVTTLSKKKIALG